MSQSDKDLFAEAKKLYLEQSESSYKEAYRIIKGNAKLAKVVSEDGESLLHFACKYNLIDHVKLLLSQGSDVNIAGGRLKNSPLHETCFNPNKVNRDMKSRSSHTTSLLIVKLLIKNQADVNAVNKYSTTPLHSCCIEGLADCAAYLIDHGADITLKAGKAAKESTALHFAAEYGWASITKLLLARGADRNVTNGENKVPYQVAIESTVIFDENMRKAVCDMFETDLTDLSQVDVNIPTPEIQGNKNTTAGSEAETGTSIARGNGNNTHGREEEGKNATSAAGCCVCS